MQNFILMEYMLLDFTLLCYVYWKYAWQSAIAAKRQGGVIKQNKMVILIKYFVPERTESSYFV